MTYHNYTAIVYSIILCCNDLPPGVYIGSSIEGAYYLYTI